MSTTGKIAAAVYGALLAAFWEAARHFQVAQRIGGHLPTGFAAFALLLLPLWAFGFGAAEWLQARLSGGAARVLAPALLLIPYLLFTLPRGDFRWLYCGVLLALTVGVAALCRLARSTRAEWTDAVALPALAAPVMFGLLGGAFPHPGLSGLPKLLLLDAALYAYLVVRGLPGVGLDFRPQGRDLSIGLREWIFFTPPGIAGGLALRFIRPHAGWPGAAPLAGAALVTFFFVALPEEIFFRGLLQNLLESRWGSGRALATTSILFGLCHLHHAPRPNWRYAILAATAGAFYGRAWRDRRRILCSATTHTLVDVLWGAWFRS